MNGRGQMRMHTYAYAYVYACMCICIRIICICSICMHMHAYGCICISKCIRTHEFGILILLVGLSLCRIAKCDPRCQTIDFDFLKLGRGACCKYLACENISFDISYFAEVPPESAKPNLNRSLKNATRRNNFNTIFSIKNYQKCSIIVIRNNH